MSEHQIGLFAGFLAAQVILTGCTHACVEAVGDDAEPGWLDPRPSGPPASKYAVPSSNPKDTAYVVSLGPQELLGEQDDSILSYTFVSLSKMRQTRFPGHSIHGT